MLASLLWPALASAAACPDLKVETLKKLINPHKAKKLELVFFSSWCSDCAVHLKTLKNNSAVVVGAFDSRERIERVVNKLAVQNACFMEAGLVKRLGIRVVPATRLLGWDDIIALEK